MKQVSDKKFSKILKEGKIKRISFMWGSALSTGQAFLICRALYKG